MEVIPEMNQLSQYNNGLMVVSLPRLIFNDKDIDLLPIMYENKVLSQKIDNYSPMDFPAELSACTDCEAVFDSDSLITCSSCGSVVCSNCLSPHFEFQCYICFIAQNSK